MKNIITILILLLSSQVFSYDGAYECGVVQKNDFNNIATKVLNANSYYTKAKEMESRGDQTTLLKQLNEAEKLILSFEMSSKNKDYCYSYQKQFDYLKLKASKLKLKISIYKSKFKNSNSCDFSIAKIKNNLENYRSLASVAHTRYILISKGLNKTNILANSKECNREQKEQLFKLFDEQNKKLESLYNEIKLSSKN